MSSYRLKNSIKNSVVAVLLKVLQIAFPFISRTIVIRMLGFSYVGVSGLFTSIFGVLGIAELGVGSAMLHALYEPIQNGQKERINAILNFYRKAYSAIGIAILALGFLLIPFLKAMIKPGTYPDNLNIYYMYLVNLTGTVCSYLVYSYKSLLLEAHQMGRIVTRIRIWMTVALYAVQIIILLLTRNYYLYISVSPIVTILSAVWTARAADRIYPMYMPVGKIGKSEKAAIVDDVKALFLYKIGGVVFNSVDSLVISWWFGALVLGIYNNYYYIVSSVATMILVVYNAILPSVGSSTVGASVRENHDNFMRAAFFDSWLIGWCAICLACLLPPFIDLWVGSDGNLGLGYSMLFGVYFYCWRILDPVAMYRDALGLWKMDKWRPLITAIANLILNLVLTMTIGLSGILLSSIVSVMVSYPFSVKCLFKYFGRNPKIYYVQMAKITILIVLLGMITWILCSCLSGIGTPIVNFLLKLLICVFFPNSAFFIIFRKENSIAFVKEKLLLWIRAKG